MTLALGIDPGTATTGYGFVRLEPDGELAAVKYGVILTPAHTPDHERLLALYRELRKLILLHRPDSVAVEKLFFQRNISTAITVGQARGVILLAIAEAGLDMGEYTPNEVKQAVAGYGSAGKKQVQEMVRTLLGLAEIPKPDDAADALAVAITHLHTKRY
ncbi:MAG: crossover junction endodeoxyribonuclease RuvC [Chloroflexi bacterium]|nr:crossover junction endodeoxyribonuclease RuvC [Chloroflexota bacterium]MBI3340326.1 crossover junction endodeoxyribonuclease RuvC [Chloroflexota bacterium]